MWDGKDKVTYSERVPSNYALWWWSAKTSADDDAVNWLEWTAMNALAKW